MSTARLTYPNVISIWRGLAIGLILILIITSLVLIVGAILTMVHRQPGMAIRPTQYLLQIFQLSGS
jgi:hypothetical protein